MIRYDEETNMFNPTDLGRVASHYYITYETVKIFNEMLKPDLTLEEAMKIICSATVPLSPSPLSKSRNSSNCMFVMRN